MPRKFVKLKTVFSTTEFLSMMILKTVNSEVKAISQDYVTSLGYPISTFIITLITVIADDSEWSICDSLIALPLLEISLFNLLLTTTFVVVSVLSCVYSSTESYSSKSSFVDNR